MRIRLNIAYDGSAYNGWQIQPDARTIQHEIEKGLSQFFGGSEIRIYGSGRTDTGVHAVGQVAHVDVEEHRDSETYLKGLKALLPDDIQVWRVREVEDSFHARYSARQRIYVYRLMKQDSIFNRNYGWFPGRGFDANRASDAARLFLGKHDFRRFSTKPDEDESTICNIQSVDVLENESGWMFQIQADRFLRRMVRTLVGTLVEIGRGQQEQEIIPALFNDEDIRAGVPAPPQGLALVRVRYDNDDEGDCPPPSPWGP